MIVGILAGRRDDCAPRFFSSATNERRRVVSPPPLSEANGGTYPLPLTEGTNNEVLPVFVWRLWDEGEIGCVGAIGSIMGLSLVVLRAPRWFRARHGSKTDNAMKAASPRLRALDHASLRGLAARNGR
jgi:hypothetical protein